MTSKKSEICFLQNYSNENIIGNKSYLHIRKCIKDYINSNSKDYTETSFLAHTKINNPVAISYSYQRFDLSLKIDNWLNFIYGFSKIKNASTGFLLSSGMSAIHAIITTLAKLKIENKIIFTNLPYFETYNLMTRYYDFFNVIQIEKYDTHSDGILWIDSSSPIITNINFNKNHNIVIVDTSCFEPKSEKLEKIISKFKSNSLIILNRSHIKLDCFGLEISRLGSLVFIFPDKNQKNYEMGNLIYEQCKDLISFNGSNVEMKNIYSWLGNEEFFKLTKLRTKRIRYFCNALRKTLDGKLNKNLFQILYHEHELYFTIRFLDGSIIENPNDFAMSMAKKAIDKGLPIRGSGSFGLNKVCLDGFEWNLDNKFKHIRISSSDLAKKYINIIADFLNNELENIHWRNNGN